MHPPYQGGAQMPVHPSILQKGGAHAPVHPPPSYGPARVKLCTLIYLRNIILRFDNYTNINNIVYCNDRTAGFLMVLAFTFLKTKKFS